MEYESNFEDRSKNYKEDFVELLDELAEEGRWAHEPDMREELDEVYSKAKAYDRMMALLNRVMMDDNARETVGEEYGAIVYAIHESLMYKLEEFGEFSGDDEVYREE